MDLDRTGRTAFLLIDDETKATLREFREVLAPRIDGILDNFYRHVTSAPNLAAIFGGPDRVAHARGMQRKHWMDSVFAGNFDERYFAQVTEIGKVHQRIGLEPRWYANLTRQTGSTAKTRPWISQGYARICAVYLLIRASKIRMNSLSVARFSPDLLTHTSVSTGQ
jgi:hypothetical protein